MSRVLLFVCGQRIPLHHVSDSSKQKFKNKHEYEKKNKRKKKKWKNLHCPTWTFIWTRRIPCKTVIGNIPEKAYIGKIFYFLIIQRCKLCRERWLFKKILYLHSFGA